MKKISSKTFYLHQKDLRKICRVFFVQETHKPSARGVAPIETKNTALIVKQSKLWYV